MVSSLFAQHVVKVACGSGDAHTLCVTNLGHVYSWGDGDYGKLGRGGSDGTKVPCLIDKIQNVHIIDVYCGVQFSMALSKDGRVYSWGKGDDNRLGHANDDHVRYPKIIESLHNKKIIALHLGLGHTLALSDDGEVYAWGKNRYRQVNEQFQVFLQEPTMVDSLKGQRIAGICTGPMQSFAWSEYRAWIPPTRQMFVIELNESTFKILDQLLEMVCDDNKQITQHVECIGVATLHLLLLQLHSIISNNVDTKLMNMSAGSKLLASLKSKIVHLASGVSVLPTIQAAAQATLQASWSVLLPTANERAQTLSSLLPNASLEPAQISCGQRFMTDLLVWSLMADGGLETALFEALRSEIAELADVDETFEMTTSHTTIPLLHLVKQLLRWANYYFIFLCYACYVVNCTECVYVFSCLEMEVL